LKNTAKRSCCKKNAKDFVDVASEGNMLRYEFGQYWRANLPHSVPSTCHFIMQSAKTLQF